MLNLKTHAISPETLVQNAVDVSKKLQSLQNLSGPEKALLKLIQDFKTASAFSHPKFFKGKNFLSAFFTEPKKFMEIYTWAESKNVSFVLEPIRSILKAVEFSKPVVACSGNKSIIGITTRYVYDAWRHNGQRHELKYYEVNSDSKKVCADMACPCHKQTGQYINFEKGMIGEFFLGKADLADLDSIQVIDGKIALLRYSFLTFYEFNQKNHMNITVKLLKDFIDLYKKDFGFPANKEGKRIFDFKTYQAHFIFQMEQALRGQSIVSASPIHSQPRAAKRTEPTQGLLFN